MKLLSVLLLLTLAVYGCEQDKDAPDNTLTDGFYMVLGDEYIIDNKIIDYYDFSAHLIYLKKDSSFLDHFSSGGSFRIFADYQEVYTGSIQPAYFSSISMGPVIHCFPSLFQNFVISIDLEQIMDSLSTLKPDPRKNEKIIQALKRYNQYHEGLEVQITSVDYVSETNRVILQLKLQNNDSFNYYYLDPAKTGMELYHYFTNGLSFRNTTTKDLYTHNVKFAQPEPWNSWKMEWLSLIKSNESKTIILTYSDFDKIPSGHYRVIFDFPGLHYQISKKVIQQENGRIWLGGMKVTGEAEIR